MSKEYNDRDCKPLREPYNELLTDADLKVTYYRWLAGDGEPGDCV